MSSKEKVPDAWDDDWVNEADVYFWPVLEQLKGI